MKRKLLKLYPLPPLQPKYTAEPKENYRRLPKASNISHIIEQYQSNITATYSTASAGYEKLDSLALELVLDKATELAESYEQRIDVDKFLHALPDRGILVNYFVKQLCKRALALTYDDVCELAIAAEIREVINRYAMANNRKGRIIAYLFAMEYGEQEDFDNDVNDDAIVESFGDIEQISFDGTALGFVDFDSLEEVKYRQ